MWENKSKPSHCASIHAVSVQFSVLFVCAFGAVKTVCLDKTELWRLWGTSGRELWACQTGMCFKPNAISFEQDVAQSRTANNVLDILNSDLHDRSISKYGYWNADTVRRCALTQTKARSVCKICYLLCLHVSWHTRKREGPPSSGRVRPIGMYSNVKLKPRQIYTVRKCLYKFLLAIVSLQMANTRRNE